MDFLVKLQYSYQYNIVTSTIRCGIEAYIPQSIHRFSMQIAVCQTALPISAPVSSFVVTSVAYENVAIALKMKGVSFYKLANEI